MLLLLFGFRVFRVVSSLLMFAYLSPVLVVAASLLLVGRTDKEIQIVYLSAPFAPKVLSLTC